jgi:hypothetical protein
MPGGGIQRQGREFNMPWKKEMLILKTSRAAYVPPSCFAWIHLGLGNVGEAFTWMDRAIDGRDPIIVPIKSYPFLDPLRADPRFHALLRKMNLEE